MPDYFVLTQIIIDDIYLPDGQVMKNQLGGGAYTAVGMRLWSDNVGICSGIGPDFAGKYDQWFLTNGIDVAGAPRRERCTHAQVKYFPDGEREEILIPGYGSHRLMQAEFDEIPASYGSCKGMYLFKDCEENYWGEAKRYFERYPMVKIWEIFGAAAAPKNRDTIAECLSTMELFSINLTEGKRLIGLDDPIAIVKALHDMHARVLILRMGANGALVSDKKHLYHIPAAAASVVDVTGGGNASTGGFLAGYCESNGDIRQAGICAAVSASFIIEQYSVPPLVDDHLRARAKQRALQLRVEKLL